MPADTAPDVKLPKSLEGHVVPVERLALIAPHMATLSETALAVSDRLPLQADVADFVAVMEKAGE